MSEKCSLLKSAPILLAVVENRFILQAVKVSLKSNFDGLACLTWADYMNNFSFKSSGLTSDVFLAVRDWAV